MFRRSDSGLCPLEKRAMTVPMFSIDDDTIWTAFERHFDMLVNDLLEIVSRTSFPRVVQELELSRRGPLYYVYLFLDRNEIYALHQALQQVYRERRMAAPRFDPHKAPDEEYCEKVKELIGLIEQRRLS